MEPARLADYGHRPGVPGHAFPCCQWRGRRSHHRSRPACRGHRPHHPRGHYRRDRRMRHRSPPLRDTRDRWRTSHHRAVAPIGSPASCVRIWHRLTEAARPDLEPGRSPADFAVQVAKFCPFHPGFFRHSDGKVADGRQGGTPGAAEGSGAARLLRAAAARRQAAR
jgi:hypothetical protein